MSKTFKKPEGAAQASGLTFIKPAELAANETRGVIAEGLYVGTMPNQYDENKPSVKIQAEDGSIIVVNAGGNLLSQMARVKLGQLTQISYLGKQKIKSGKMKGKEAHNFEVLVAD